MSSKASNPCDSYNELQRAFRDDTAIVMKPEKFEQLSKADGVECATSDEQPKHEYVMTRTEEDNNNIFKITKDNVFRAMTYFLNAERKQMDTEKRVVDMRDWLLRKDIKYERIRACKFIVKFDSIGFFTLKASLPFLDSDTSKLRFSAMSLINKSRMRNIDKNAVIEVVVKRYAQVIAHNMLLNDAVWRLFDVCSNDSPKERTQQFKAILNAITGERNIGARSNAQNDENACPVDSKEHDVKNDIENDTEKPCTADENKEHDKKKPCTVDSKEFADKMRSAKFIKDRLSDEYKYTLDIDSNEKEENAYVMSLL